MNTVTIEMFLHEWCTSENLSSFILLFNPDLIICRRQTYASTRDETMTKRRVYMQYNREIAAHSQALTIENALEYSRYDEIHGAVLSLQPSARTLADDINTRCVGA